MFVDDYALFCLENRKAIKNVTTYFPPMCLINWSIFTNPSLFPKNKQRNKLGHR